MLLKCLRLKLCRGPVVKTHYSHKTTTTTRTTIVQEVSEHCE